MQHWACGEDSSVRGWTSWDPGRSMARKVRFLVGRGCPLLETWGLWPLDGGWTGTLGADPTHEL